MRILARQLALNEAVAFAEIDDEAVLLNVETGVYFGLSAVGCRIWKLLEETQDEEALLDRLLGEYDVELDQAAEDLREFLDELVSRGLAREIER